MTSTGHGDNSSHGDHFHASPVLAYGENGTQAVTTGSSGMETPSPKKEETTLRESPIADVDGGESRHQVIDTITGDDIPPNLGSPTGSENRTIKGRHKKRWPRVPWLRLPIANDDGPWLRQDQHAGQWLNLFFDLSVAAVLAAFGTNHDITTPGRIPDYLSYFAIIQWIWMNQTCYDTRFQAEDVVHRGFKSAQICLFVYIGAASGNWNLRFLQDPKTLDIADDDNYEKRVMANDSFVTVVLCFMIARALLATQYALSAIIGRKAGRRIGLQISSIVGTLIALIVSTVSLAVPPNTNGKVVAKVALLYCSIAVEFVMLVIQLRPRFSHFISVGVIAERYGALTLIILGETGFNSLTKAFSRAISGISEDNGPTYAQVFLSIGVILLLYLFLFSWFRPHEEITERRALGWQLFHIPLHFSIVLLLSAIVNVVVVISFAQGLDIVASAYGTVLETVLVGQSLTTKQYDNIDRILSRLDLTPPWKQHAKQIAYLSNQTNPTTDVDMIVLQYFGQIIYLTATSYGVEISDEAQTIFTSLTTMNQTYNPDVTARTVLHSHAFDILYEFAELPFQESLAGTLWFFPCAGAVLIFAAIRSFLWYRLAGIDHYLIHGAMIFFGIGLGLMGLLGIGPKPVFLDTESSRTIAPGAAPIYEMAIEGQSPMAVVFAVYAVTYFGAVALAALFRRREIKKLIAARKRGKTERI